ncbi:MAG: putative virulence factor [Bacteroidales bacterium]|nr:putative virulence factor [Bacteroidales bacterium]
MTDLIEQQNQNLIQNVKNQINSINDFIQWNQAHQPEGRKVEVFKKLIDKRRQLKRYLFSLSSNPAIAAFGESQKGKSYVISSLLAAKRKQFTVTDKDGHTYDFIEEMNPPTNDTEATGVVTRFTYHYDIMDENFPIKVKLLSISDILQILCNTAYLDVKDHVILPKEEINEYMESIERRYKGMPDVQSVLDEDDVLNLREHIERYMSNRAHEFLGSDFFDVLAQCIRKIQPKDWPTIMAKMWYDNPDITQLFRRILDGYQTVNYAQELFIPISALLNVHTTLMSTRCLQKLEDNTPTVGNANLDDGTDILLVSDGTKKIVRGFGKSILSAMTAEVVFQLQKEAVDEQLRFCLDGIYDERIKSHLLAHGWNQAVSKEFLKNVDILDFPGARSRLDLNESQINKELSQMILRGKVGYLFNKYSDEKLINVLMVCHDHMQNASSTMPPILKKWVEDNIGNTPAERSAFIDKSIISPLFLIATKFNLDMKRDVSETKNVLIDERWDGRFSKVLYDQIVMARSNTWFDVWTPTGSFKNTYLLRDYKWSGDSGNRLFKGYVQHGEEIEENDVEFHQKLKQSFMANQHVKRFFDDVELAWDSACTLNNDGATLIIQKLSIVASNAKESRLFKNQRDIKEIYTTIMSLMTEYYHDENDADILQKAISRSGAIIAEFDVMCGRDNYFFGRMIHNLQISENYVFDYYYNALNTTKMISQREVKEYDLIIARCHGRLSASNPFDVNLEILRKEYRFATVADCRNFFENVKKISLDKLFECNYKAKSNSQQLAEGIVEKWLTDISSQKNLKFFEVMGCNTLTMLDLMENIKAVAETVGLSKSIAKTISPYVDAISVPHQVLDMIADTTAEMINDFVITFGYLYYDEAKIAELQQINETHDLHLAFDVKQEKIPMSPDELSDLFDDIRPTEENDTVSSLPSFINYNRWIDYLVISFIASYNVPTYDIEANKKLGVLLQVYKDLA